MRAIPGDGSHLLQRCKRWVRNVHLIRGVLIVRKEDGERVIGLLEELGAECHVRTVVLTAEDQKELGRRRDEPGQRSPSV